MKTEIIHEIYLVLNTFRDGKPVPMNARVFLSTSDLYRITHCEQEEIDIYFVDAKPVTYLVDYMRDTETEKPYHTNAPDGIQFLIKQVTTSDQTKTYTDPLTLILPSTPQFITNCERLLSYDTFVSDIIYGKISDTDFMNFRKCTFLTDFEKKVAIENGDLDPEGEKMPPEKETFF